MSHHGQSAFPQWQCVCVCACLYHTVQPTVPPPLSMSDITYTLWCLIGGDEAPFSVTVLPTMSIDQLKATVKERKGVVLQNVSATELILWKVR